MKGLFFSQDQVWWCTDVFARLKDDDSRAAKCISPNVYKGVYSRCVQIELT